MYQAKQQVNFLNIKVVQDTNLKIGKFDQFLILPHVKIAKIAMDPYDLGAVANFVRSFE